MNTDPNKNLAGPLVFEQSVIERDAAIREENDGPRIDDNAVCEYVTHHQNAIFELQSEFFAELRDKADKAKP
jgi:hypothetical protein